MAVPLNPTVTQIVTEGLKRGGRVTPSATDITNATDNQLREVKADIMLVCPTLAALQKTTTAATFVGEQHTAFPADANIPVSLLLLDGPDEYRGTATAGSGSSISFALTFPVVASTELNGLYILITSGMGIGQYREIRSYVPGTVTATVSPTWTTNPDNTSVYLVVTRTNYLWDASLPTDIDREPFSLTLGRPITAARFAEEFTLYYVPDKVYGLLFRYYIDIDQLDETDTIFVNLLRELRSVWIQGIAVKTMQRYDEDRYQLELGVYQQMLTYLTVQTTLVSQMQFRDI
jgi:hypothetical protein